MDVDPRLESERNLKLHGVESGALVSQFSRAYRADFRLQNILYRPTIRVFTRTQRSVREV